MQSPEELPEEVLDWLEGGSGRGVPPPVRGQKGPSPEREEELADYRRIWHLSRAPRARDAWADISSRIDREESLTPRRGAGWRVAAPLRMAAMLVLALGIGALVFLYLAPAPAGEPVVATTLPGTHSTVELPDGSIVRLNAASSLSYPPSLEERYEVRLTGEAYFAVRPDLAREFVVWTQESTVRVVGTEFNVRARDRAVQVAVVEGEVEFEAHGSRVRLQAGQRSQAAAGQPPAAAEPVEPSLAGAWMHGVLALDDETLAQAAAEVERRFGVRIQVDEAIARRRITATIRTRSADDAAEAICLAVGARCERSNGDWRIARVE